MNRIQEKLLLFKLRLGQDPESFGKLYDLYVSRIYRFIYFKVPTSEEAQDSTSEVFLKLWEYIKDGKPVRTIGPLLFQIARNSVIDFYRARTKTGPSGSLEDFANLVDEKGLARLKLHGDLHALRNALHELKDEYREVIVLHHIEGFEHREIAAIIGKSSVATRVLLHRAMQTLKGLIKI